MAYSASVKVYMDCNKIDTTPVLPEPTLSEEVSTDEG